MKKLSDYIDDELFDIQRCKILYNQECYLNSMQEFFGDELPEGFSESINNLDFKDYILESLTSHDINLFIKKIKDEFDVEISFVNDKKQALIIVSDIDLTYNQKFNSMLEIFGYYVTKNDFNSNEFIITVCPRYAKDVNDLVYNKHHGKLYHFTASNNAEEIERLGLRCKKSVYRNFPERIYLYSSEKNLNKIQDIKNFIKKVTNPFGRRNNKLCVYRIDLNKLNTRTFINFYTDDLMDEENAVYTYNNIPKECITKLNINFDDLM